MTKKRQAPDDLQSRYEALRAEARAVIEQAEAERPVWDAIDRMKDIVDEDEEWVSNKPYSCPDCFSRNLPNYRHSGDFCHLYALGMGYFYSSSEVDWVEKRDLICAQASIPMEVANLFVIERYPAPAWKQAKR